MHNNYYFLRQLTKALSTRIDGSVVSECFSQTKDELVIRFESGAESFVIRASLTPAFSCLSFPREFQRARKNSVDLFGEIVGARVTGIRQFDNERSFALMLSDKFTLLFKMHASRTNVVLFENDTARDLFRKNFTADLNIRLDALDREIDWGREAFLDRIHELRKLYFTFGKVVWEYLEEHGFRSQDATQQWDTIQRVLQQINSPSYYITLLKGKPILSLLEIGEIRNTVLDPLEAANDFFHFIAREHTFVKLKNNLVSTLKARLGAGENYYRKNSQKLEEVLSDNHYKMWADLIMANLHAIEPGAERVTVENFYEDQRPVEIRLRRDLSPQQTAAIYYRKAKNQHIEISRLERSVQQKKEEIHAIQSQLADIEAAADMATLKEIEERVNPRRDKSETEALPYHEFHFRGYRIWVGKNAKANDVLSFKYGYKDDLWLHAKDVSGSHVLTKFQSGKNFPKEVIEYAASLAAYHSKRKHESLCPVVVTPRKYIRKRKGDPPGAVVVEREEIVMVKPAAQPE